jgi:sugar phosphate isomerase/epimerase
MRIAVSMWSYFQSWRAGKLDLGGFIREAKKAGADAVELLDFFYNEPSKDRVEEFAAAYLAPKRKQIEEALKETGLPVPIFSVSNNFAKADRELRELALRKIHFGVDEALRYGAEVVRVFAGDVSPGVTFRQAYDWILEGLELASNYAEPKGIKLALENHGTLAGRSDQVLKIIEDVRGMCLSEVLGANPDTGNFLLVNQPSHEAIRAVAPVAYMVHFKDFVREPAGHEGFAYEALDGTRYVGMAVGEGEVHLGECIAALKDTAFDGWLSVEYEGEEDPMTAVPRSIQNAHKYL